MKRMMRWTVTLEQDEFSKDYYIILPDELLENVDWKTEDTLQLDIVKMGIETNLIISKHE